MFEDLENFCLGLFCFFEHIFNICFTADRWVGVSTSPFSLWICCFVPPAKKEKNGLTQTHGWKRGKYSSSFLRLWKIFFFVLDQKSTRGGFLKVGFSVESENISINLSCFVVVKSISLSCTLNGYFIHSWICNITHWLFGKYRFAEFCTSSKFDTFHYAIAKKSHSLISPSISL